MNMRGTSDWQLDRMFETECAEAWENQQERPVAICDCSFDRINNAWAALETARPYMDFVLQQISQAADMVMNTPPADKLNSLHDQLTDLQYEVNTIRNELKGEAHRAWVEGRIA